MTKFVGRRGSLGIAVESSRGTAVNPQYWLPYVTMSFFDRTETAREEQGLGNIADSDSLYVTLKMGEGEVESQLYDAGLGYILSSLLGATPSTSGGDPYTHSFSVDNTNTAQSLSLYWSDPDRSYMFSLAVVDSLQITVEPGGIVNYTIGFKSKYAQDWTAQTPDFTSLGNKFLHQHLSFKLASAVGGLSGSTAISLKNLDLTIARNSSFDSVMGTVEPEDVLSQQLSVEGTIGLNLEDDTYRNYMLDNTYRAMEIFLNRSTSSQLKLQFPRVDFTQWEPDYTLNEIAQQQINIKANYDSANGLDIISTCDLVNSVSSY